MTKTDDSPLGVSGSDFSSSSRERNLRVAPHSFEERFDVYRKLSKLDLIPEVYLGIPIAWSLLGPQLAFSWRTGLLLGLALVAEVATFAMAVTLDDIQGKRDGVDRFNYLKSDRAGLRKLELKPLLQGRLSETQALRFAVIAGTIAFSTCFLAYALMDFRPAWLLPAALVIGALAVQYSFGLKVSYRGIGEVTLLVATASGLCLPFVLLTGQLHGTSLFEGLLFGVWMLQISMFSNTHDAEGDRRAGRLTVAARTSARGNRIFLASIFVLGYAILALADYLGSMSSWFWLTLIPFFILQVKEVHAGLIRHDPLLARAIALKAFRIGSAILFVTNILVGTGGLRRVW